MKTSTIIAGLSACLALSSPLVAKAATFNDGTYEWWFDTYKNKDEVQVARISGVSRIDDEPLSGALAVPGYVSTTTTNEFGYSTYDEAADKNIWVSTRAQRISTMTFAVEDVSGVNFGNKVTSIAFPDTVKTVDGVSAGTNLVSVTLPAGLEQVQNSFNAGADPEHPTGCAALSGASVPATARIIKSFMATPWLKSLGEFAVWGKDLVGYNGQGGAVVVPDGVTVIGYSAFNPQYNPACTNITSVTLPQSLEEIGPYSFQNCGKLASVNIPAGVFSIGGYAFNKTALAAVDLPTGLRAIGQYPFAYTPITSLVIPEGPKNLSYTCAYCTNLTSATLPSTARILDWTFSGCRNLTAVDIPASVRRLEYAFSGCTNLVTITGGAGLEDASRPFGSSSSLYGYDDSGNLVAKIPYLRNSSGFLTFGSTLYGYMGDMPEHLAIPDGIRNIADGFVGYGVCTNRNFVQTVTLADSVENVGDDAFSSCAEIGSVNLGAGVTNIGAYAFCSTVSNVTGGASLKFDLALQNTKFAQNSYKDCGKDGVPFGFVGIGSVIFGYNGHVPAQVEIPDYATQVCFGFFEVFNPADPTCGFDSAVSNLTSVSSSAALIGGIPTFLGAYGLTELIFPNTKLETYPELGDDYTNIVNVTLGVDPENFAIESDAFFYSHVENGLPIPNVKFVADGYRLVDYTVGYGIEEEKLTADNSVFGYVGRRDFYSWYAPEYTIWSPFTMRANFRKALSDDNSAAEPFAGAKANIEGMIFSADGKFAGTFTAEIKKAGKDGVSKATVKIVPVNGKKVTIKGSIDAAGNGLEGLAGLVFTATGVTGSVINSKTGELYQLDGSVEVAKKSPAAVLLKALKGSAWGVVFEAKKAQTDFTKGNVALSLSMGSDGKVKITGVLPDGTKISLEQKALVGSGNIAIPVVYSKSSASFGFILWLDEMGKAVAVTDMTDWTIKVKVGKKKQVISEKCEVVEFGDAGKGLAYPIFMMQASNLPESLGDVFMDALPLCQWFEIKSSGKWSFAKAAKVKFKKGVFDWEAYNKSLEQGKTNASGLKLSLTKKTGVFKGSFTIFVLKGDKLKEETVDVNGVMVNGAGYGVGTIKKSGAFPIKIGFTVED